MQPALKMSAGRSPKRAYIDPAVGAELVAVDDEVFDESKRNEVSDDCEQSGYHYYPGLLRRTDQYDPLKNMSNNKGVYTFGAWGVRKTKTKQNEQNPKRRLNNKVNHPNLPLSALAVDPTTKRAPGPCSSRTEGRFSGAWTLTPPYNKRYGYYKTYGTADRHGYPCGMPPSPIRIYSTGTSTTRPLTPNSEVTGKVSSSPYVRPKTAPSSRKKVV